MNLFKKSITLALVGILSLGSVQQSQAQMADTTPTVVGIASSNEVFSTLVAAVKAADLVGTLEGEGPFTVFAPTNDAFGKLADGTVETLLKPENKQSLVGILTYHVVAGKFMAADVVKAIEQNNNSFVVETVQGSPLTLSLKDGAVMVIDENGNSAKVTATDVKASNGVIHVIDAVVLPK